jgi:hypothetical protein
MAKGDELMKKRNSLLRGLYDKGAISDDTCVLVSEVMDLEGVELEGVKGEEELGRLVSLLEEEKLIRLGKWRHQNGYYLSAAGFNEAAEISVGPEGVFFR